MCTRVPTMPPLIRQNAMSCLHVDEMWDDEHVYDPATGEVARKPFSVVPADVLKRARESWLTPTAKIDDAEWTYMAYPFPPATLEQVENRA